jgi:nucleoside-diphosphate-sugar epimerase
MMPAGIIFMLCRISSWRYNQYTTFCLGLAIMESKVVLVTGSSGFLGSVICADLSRDHDVIGVDRREPTAALRRKVVGGRWHTLDIADPTAATALFDHLAADRRTLHCVLHMAAFYHFGRHWLPEDDRVNVRGLRHILEGAVRLGTRRFLFAGSVASLPPPLAGSVLSEKSSPVTATAYTRSKTIGEALLGRYSGRMPTLALRIGGVFSDWCELPPLYSLMKLWSQPGFMGRMIPGRGISGFPYIHRRDLVQCVRRIIERQDSLAPSEVLFVSPPGCTTHNELFAAIRSACSAHCDPRPLFVAPWLARCFLFLKNRAKVVLGRKRYERRWMMDYVDKPLVVDTAYTREKLQWTPGPELSILNRIPVLMRRFSEDRSTWERRNVSRNEGRYVYEDD